MNTTQKQQNIVAMRWVLWGSTAIMLVKFTAFWITKSNAILADALESIVNVVAGAFAFVSLKIAAKPKDANHPYGHGKIEFVSAGLEGGLIFTAGFFIIYKSIVNLTEPHELSGLDAALILSSLAGALNLFMGKYLINLGKKNHSLVLQADGHHLMSDVYTSVGLVVGLLLIYLTGWWWLDGVFAIIFAGIILFTGYKLVRKSLAGLLDETDGELINEVLESLNKIRKPIWIDIHNLRVVKHGTMIHIDCHLTLPFFLSLKQTHDQLKLIEDELNSEFNNRLEIFIHPDPCEFTSCSICQVTDCPQRKFKFLEKVTWNAGNVLLNTKHKI